MTAISWVKFAWMPRPMPWVIPPTRLERTTAECLWKSLVRNVPFGLTDTGLFDLPSAAVVMWICWVCIGDEASSNKRMWAFMESRLLASRKQMITCLLPCIVHILHRSVVPILQTDHIHVELYRTGHVLIQLNSIIESHGFFQRIAFFSESLCSQLFSGSD